MPLQQTAFWNHSDTMFSTFSHKIHSIIRDFPFFDKICSKSFAVECCCMRESVKAKQNLNSLKKKNKFKTWQKKKLLNMPNFSFCYIFFKSLRRQKVSICGTNLRISVLENIMFCKYNLFDSFFLATLTLSHIQNVCIRRFWKHLKDKIYKNVYRYWIELLTLRQKENSLIMSNISFFTMFYKLSAADAWKSCRWERFKHTFSYQKLSRLSQYIHLG